MNANTRRNLGVALVAVVAVLAPAITRAGVTRVEISSRQDVLGGKTFGTNGAYEKLSGKVYFAVDPNNQHNKIIADIDKAPRNSQGKVEFSADLFILRPKDPSRGNGVLLFDVPNRGRNGGLSALNRAKASADPATEEELATVCSCAKATQWCPLAGNLTSPRKRDWSCWTLQSLPITGSPSLAGSTLGRGSSPTS